MSQETKAARLLRLLKRGVWVTQQAMLRAGGYRYGARLFTLRRQGWRVETKSLGGGEFRYRLRRTT